MTDELKALNDYLHSIEKAFAAGNATEHTHRPALKKLIEDLAGTGTTATNEPQRIKCGAPDFIITKGSLTIGYAETKDVDKSLDDAEKTDQIKRYLGSLSNFILTDYLEFRWFMDGKLRQKARMGATSNGKIKHTQEGVLQVSELLESFLQHKAQSVGTPKELALRMARLAHLIRNLIINTFSLEADKGSLHTQLAAFRESLIPDLSNEQFADMYAQTIAYGLFAARCTEPQANPFTRQSAAYILPKTNPFLRQLFSHIAGPELDDRIAWCVDDLAQVIDQADMAEVLKDFGKHLGKEDPVVHFYETFLKAYDPEVKEMRGVYYTPESVVSYIVRSIEHILKTQFGRTKGLADEKTLMLDPAVGTATFLYTVVNGIREAVVKQGQQGNWNDYVAEKLLPRLFGFELLMAPYAVAHLKLGLLLKETGYEFNSEQRLGIYLTNTLEAAFKKSEQLSGFNEYIVDEANAAAEIKKEKPIMVVLGNPPYSGNSANQGDWAKQLVATYKVIDGKPLGERNPKWLQDDYVKFLAFGQWRIERTGQGILGFITNHSYLDNPTFRGMRQSLMKTFTDIFVFNLHGSAKRKEVTPDGGKDENVFDIQQGVAIGIFIKEPGNTSPAAVHYADLWGLREAKYQVLLTTSVNDTEWTDLKPNSPFYLFKPRDEAQLGEYEKGWKVTDVFPVNSVGIVTSRDDFVFDFDAMTLKNRIAEFRAVGLSDDEIRCKYKLKDNKVWNVADARKDVRLDNDYGNAFTECLYRPFDIRRIFYHKKVIERSRMEVMRHMLAGDNLGLISARSNKSTEMNHFFCSSFITETKCGESTTQSCLFPLYLYPVKGEMQFDEGHRHSNLNPLFVSTVSAKLGLKLVDNGGGDFTQTFGPDDIFNYAYAIFHSPIYRTRYAEFLKMDFPRLPLTSDRDFFKELTAKGAELVALHLMKASLLNTFITEYPVPGSNVVEKVTYSEANGRVFINKKQYFGGVPLKAWDFQIGGYQVLDKWLKERKGRSLSYDEVTHFQKVVVALKETIRLMAEIDDLIPGWPIE